MVRNVVVGAGPVGTATAELLLAKGEEVRVVTRRGTGPAGAEKVAADAGDPDRLRELTTGAAAIYNCVNPPYHRWETDWPPIAASLLAATESSGAVLATTGNLYVYGPVTAPMTEATPMAATGTKGRARAQMWRDALAASDAGRVRTFEVRGSDYTGCAENSLLPLMIVPRLRAGKTVLVPADIDAPHSWTDVRDVAALLVTGAYDERAWGRVWHVPSAAPCSVRQLSAIAADQLGVPNKVRSLPYAALWATGCVNRFAKELRETNHQLRAPFVLDSSAAQTTFDLTPTTVEDSVRHTIALLR